MTAETPFLRGLRRSILGAWLAVFYALAVLASGLAPSPAPAHGLTEGALLCSGLAPPAQDLPDQDLPDPASDPDHCKGCPVNPVLAGPPQALPTALVRASIHAAANVLSGSVDAPLAVLGLPPSRAPPASVSQLL